MWWIKRYLPKSLLWRALTILAAPIILVQAIAVWVFFDNHVDAVTRNAARSLAGKLGPAIRHLGEHTRAGSELLVAMQPLGVPFQIDAETLPRAIRVVVAGNN